MAADMAMTVLASRPLAEALASDGGTGGSGQPGNAARGRGRVTDAIDPLGDRFDRALESRIHKA
jgi:hypothetical protein